MEIILITIRQSMVVNSLYLWLEDELKVGMGDEEGTYDTKGANCARVQTVQRAWTA